VIIVVAIVGVVFGEEAASGQMSTIAKSWTHSF
jgi:hypothetical protein